MAVQGSTVTMEIEFKITSGDVAAIKQARPWVFRSDSPRDADPPPTDTEAPPPPPPDDDDSDDDDDGGGGGTGGDPGGGGESVQPQADFEVSVACEENLCRARTDIPVALSDTSSGTVRTRRWEFGDGASSRRPRIDHAWSEAGFYEVTLWVRNGAGESTATLTFLVEASKPAGTCEFAPETLCLQRSRYAVQVDSWTREGKSGPASVVHRGTDDSGLFTFFDRSNWEVLIKVLDGCALNGSVWVFGASTTDLGYSIRVRDTVTGAVQEYRNEPGQAASAITDGVAFPEGCQP